MNKKKGRAIVEKLVQGYRQRIAEMRSKKTSEAVIRQEFLDPFWEALGWDVGNRDQKPASEKEVLIEAGIDTIEDKRFRHRRCDYFFRAGGFPRLLLEAKRPSVDIDDPEAAFQTKTYAWNSKLPFAVLSNFEGFRLFDATVTPSLNHRTRGLVKEFKLSFEDYVDQWDVLWDTFSRDAVQNGSLDRLYGKIKKVRSGRRIRSADRTLFDQRGANLVDNVFLGHLESWRERLAKAIYRENKSSFPEAETRHGAANLTEAVQRLLDRIVFIRICEDREIFKYGRLQKLLDDCKASELYPRMLAIFRELDKKYNGYLFKPHALSEGIKVDGELLGNFIRSLYMPESPYCFDRISDDILGVIYERFLGSTIVVKAGHVTAESKPEVRHAGGVYYTPRFVVDCIIRRVIGPKVEGKTPEAILKTKVLDPACGSGSFLIAAYQYLVDHCTAYYEANPTKAIEVKGRGKNQVRIHHARADKNGVWHLSAELRSKLLQSCIYGVDIDQQAVEVTVMSLYIKMLETKMPQQQAFNERMLPPLSNNIRCGNSLIDPEEFADHLDDLHGPLFSELDEDTQFRINPFSWRSETRGFGRVFNESEGFDCIIGNPPYIRVQELNQWAATEVKFYKARFESCRRGNFDIYIAFIERAFELLSPNGLVGYICPHKFWQAAYGQGIRGLIAEGKRLRSIVDFGEQQVFADATTYTAIHIMGERPLRGKVSYAAVSELNDGQAQLSKLDAGKKADSIDQWKATHPRVKDGSFAFVPSEIKLYDADPKQNRPALGELCSLAQGLKTSADKVFVCEFVKTVGECALIRSSQTQAEHLVELEVIRSLVKSEHMRAYNLRDTKLRLLFPYYVQGEDWSLIPVEDWAAKYPKAWAYLNENKAVLEARERGRMKGRADWYAYIYPKNFVRLSQPKLISPDLADRMRVGFDQKGELIFSGGAAGGVAIGLPEKVDPWFLMGLLNSKLIERHVKWRGQAFRGGYLNCEIRFIRDLPIQLPRNKDEEKTAERIAKHSKTISESARRLRDSSIGDNQRERIEREIETQETQINKLVNKLYGAE